jgi:putative tricarboxylic transport membrane protein
MQKFPENHPNQRRRLIQGAQDFWGGLGLMLFSLFVFWASADLAGMAGFQLGPGTAPRLFAGVLLVLGAAVTAMGFFRQSSISRYDVRGIFFVALSLISFAILMRPIGLLIATFTSFMIAALASREQRWGQVTLVAIGITLLCSVMFPYVLKLPMQLLPWFMFP